MEELKNLYEQGFLTEQEFEERKSQVIDELTGTKKGGSSSRTPKRKKKKTVHHDDGIEQPSRPPPDFEEIKPEEAIKHIFDPHVRSWSQHPCQVRLDSEPFAKGTLRKAYYLQVFGNWRGEGRGREGKRGEKRKRGEERGREWKGGNSLDFFTNNNKKKKLTFFLSRWKNLKREPSLSQV